MYYGQKQNYVVLPFTVYSNVLDFFNSFFQYHHFGGVQSPFSHCTQFEIFFHMAYVVQFVRKTECSTLVISVCAYMHESSST